jgi:hypothetical protein
VRAHKSLKTVNWGPRSAFAHCAYRQGRAGGPLYDKTAIEIGTIVHALCEMDLRGHCNEEIRDYADDPRLRRMFVAWPLGGRSECCRNCFPLIATGSRITTSGRSCRKPHSCPSLHQYAERQISSQGSTARCFLRIPRTSRPLPDTNVSYDAANSQ